MKRQIQAKDPNYPACIQRLIFAGRQLRHRELILVNSNPIILREAGELRTLASENIGMCDTLHLVLRLPGGVVILYQHSFI